LIVVEGGETVHEWYRTDASYVRDVASVQKSVLSLLIGRAIRDRHFALETSVDEILGPGWTDHRETAGITVFHLLTMTSGLDDSLTVVSPPGQRWVYSNAFAQLFDVLTVATGRELDDIARAWLFDPADATTATFAERRATGVAPVGLRATARDLAAIGNVVRDPTHPAHDARWLEDALAPSQELNQAYGFLWWLNGQRSFVLPGQVRPPLEGALIPSAPADMVAALGKDDQKLYVSRDLDLVVARLGGKAVDRGALASSSFDDQLWQALLAARI
jgi:CubicO group peptidase (beta-lactamase class C family)